MPFMQQPHRAADVVYSDGGDYVMVDGVKYDLEVFRIHYPGVAITSLKAYRATADWNLENL